MLQIGASAPAFAAPRLVVLEHIYGSPQTGREVYKVRDASVGLCYALKGFRLAAGQGAGSVEREVNALNGQLSLPGRLPRVHAVQQVGDRCWLLLDWMDGVPMDRLFNGQPARQPAELTLRLRMVAELCATVSALHRNRCIHRDLKPHNVVVRDRGNPAHGVAVIDLGLSAQAREEAEGTDGYAAPEQQRFFRNWNLSARTDVFAIGQILATALTGQPLQLHPGPDLRQWAEAAGVVLARASVMPLPESLLRCVEECTMLLPEQRLGDVRAIADRLQRVVGRR